MKKNIKRMGIGLGVAVILLGSTVSFSEPGSDRDPLVSISYVKDYVRKNVDGVKKYVDEKIEEIPVNDRPNNTETNSFKLVEVSKGESIILEQGTEIILRDGEAKTISKIENGIDNGLSDVTSAEDTKKDQPLELNHLLLAPRNDSRGAKITKDAIFLVKGKYKIK